MEDQIFRPNRPGVRPERPYATDNSFRRPVQTNNNQYNNQPPQPQPTRQEHDEYLFPPPPPRPKKGHKKFWIFLVVFLLLAAGGAAAYYFLVYKDKNSKPTTNSQPAPAPVNTSKSTAAFYITKRPNEISIYQPAEGTRGTVKLILDGNRSLRTADINSNQSVLMSENGITILYVSTTPKPGADLEELLSTQISVLENKKETKLTEFKEADKVALLDWALSRDGKTVYYLSQKLDADKSDKPDLHMIEVADKKDTLLKEDIVATEAQRNPLFVDGDGNLFLYVVRDKKVTEHKVAAGEYTSRDVGSFTCNCVMEYPQALSPDGKLLLLEGSNQGPKKGDPFNGEYHLMNIADGKVTELAKPESTFEQWRASYWSHDARQIVFDVAWYGDAPAEFRSRIDTLDVSEKKITNIFKAQESKDEIAQILGISHDNRYMAYAHDKKVKLYDTAEKKIIDTELDAEFVGSSDSSFGWY